MSKLSAGEKKAVKAALRAEGVPSKTVKRVLEDDDDGPILVSQDKAAKLLSVSSYMIRQLEKKGKLKRTMIGRCVRYHKEELEQVALEMGIDTKGGV